MATEPWETWFLLLITLLLTSLLVPLLHVGVAQSGENEECLRGTLLYMYGESTCPFCNRLHQFFQQNFPESSYYFCVIDKYRECYEKFVDFASEMTKFSGVPQTIVVKGSSIVAIVIGADTNKSFWLQLACSQPSTEIPVYSGEQVVFTIRVNTTDHSKLISKYLVYPGKEDLASLTTIIVVVIVVVAVAGYLVYTRFRK